MKNYKGNMYALFKDGKQLGMADYLSVIRNYALLRGLATWDGEGHEIRLEEGCEIKEAINDAGKEMSNPNIT